MFRVLVITIDAFSPFQGFKSILIANEYIFTSKRFCFFRISSCTFDVYLSKDDKISTFTFIFVLLFHLCGVFHSRFFHFDFEEKLLIHLYRLFYQLYYQLTLIYQVFH